MKRQNLAIGGHPPHPQLHLSVFRQYQVPPVPTLQWLLYLVPQWLSIPLPSGRPRKSLSSCLVHLLSSFSNQFSHTRLVVGASGSDSYHGHKRTARLCLPHFTSLCLLQCPTLPALHHPD